MRIPAYGPTKPEIRLPFSEKCTMPTPPKTETIPYIPDTYDIKPDTDYLYICANNTIYGTEYWKFPEVQVPVICNMSSDILSRDIDFNRFDMIWAGIQRKPRRRRSGPGHYKERPSCHSTDRYSGISASVQYIRQKRFHI